MASNKQQRPPKVIEGTDDKKLSSVLHANGYFRHNEIDYYRYRYRFGVTNPYDTISTAKEYLFFTKPDLNIYPKNNSGMPSASLGSYLRDKPFWVHLGQYQPWVINMLQASRLQNNGDPFNHLLENTVQSNLSVPELSAETIDTPSNMYGVNYSYHGSGEASDDGFDFSLEFKDTKYLPVYNFFKAYEDYEVLDHHGVIEQFKPWIIDKVLYDEYSIYKFVVDVDTETILYYCKYYGVKSLNVPRDVFSNFTFDNGISYSINFNAAFFDDMRPSILDEFNTLSAPIYNSLQYDANPYDQEYDRADNTPAKAAMVIPYSSGPMANAASGANKSGTSMIYKLKWRTDKKDHHYTMNGELIN